jgi:serine/threonine-protein kinase
VATLIRQQLGEEIKLQQLRSGTRNTQAWSLVQQAEQFRKRGEAAAAQRDTVGLEREFGAADSLLTLAETADAQWAEPAVQRAFLAYRRSRLAGLNRPAIEQWVNAGLGHVDRALKLDPSDPDALEIRGNLQYWFFLMGLQPDPAKGNELLLAAKKDLEEATRINPTQAGAHASLSHLYYRTGTSVDVYTAARAAYQADAFLDNAAQILSRLFTSSYDLEQFTDSRFWCDETKARFPASADVPRCELFLLTTKRDTAANIDQAWKLADSMAALTPGARQEQTRLRAQTMVAVVIARSGKLADSARNVIERSKGNAEIDPTRDISLLSAFAYAQLGDKEKAVGYLKIYFSVNDRLRAGFANDPGWQFRSLVDDPGFRRVVGSQ